jgi:hypothetical protein
MDQLFRVSYVLSYRPYDSSNVDLPADSRMRISLHEKHDGVKIIALLNAKEGD